MLANIFLKLTVILTVAAAIAAAVAVGKPEKRHSAEKVCFHLIRSVVASEFITILFLFSRI